MAERSVTRWACEDMKVDDDLVKITEVTWREADQRVVAYNFDLMTNDLKTIQNANRDPGRKYVFKAYRVPGDSTETLTLRESSR